MSKALRYREGNAPNRCVVWICSSGRSGTRCRGVMHTSAVADSESEGATDIGPGLRTMLDQRTSNMSLRPVQTACHAICNQVPGHNVGRVLDVSIKRTFCKPMI